jgi:HlyD family secretion protein
MNSTLVSSSGGTWVPQLQAVLQQQLAQVGEQIPAFNHLQIQCAVESGRLLIAIDLLSPIDLESQKIFWVLEEFVRDWAPELPLATAKPDPQTPASLAVKLSLRGGGYEPTDAAHMFTLTATAFVFAVKEPTAAATSGLTHPPSLASAQIGARSIAERFRRINPWVVCAIVGAGLSGGLGYYAFAQGQTGRSLPVTAPALAPASAVMALGRIEPKGEIIQLSVANAQESRVNQLLVEEGDWVQAGQVIAILQGLDKQQAAVKQAEQNVAIVQAKLAQVQAGGAKIAAVSAQGSNIARLEAQLQTETTAKQAAIVQANVKLRNAETDYQRYQMLYQGGAVSRAELEDQRDRVATAQAEVDQVNAQLNTLIATLQAQIQQERSLLSNLSEVRPVDVNVVQAELEYALTQVNQAKANLADLYVRVPTAGRILKINTRMGEQVKSGEGIVELGQTDQMYAIAEVYETDVSKIRVGQRATIVSENGGLFGEVYGTVDHIGLQIKKKNILDADPAAEKDARVVEVKVRIAPQDTPKVAGLTNLQVRVRIDL